MTSQRIHSIGSEVKKSSASPNLSVGAWELGFKGSFLLVVPRARITSFDPSQIGAPPRSGDAWLRLLRFREGHNGQNAMTVTMCDHDCRATGTKNPLEPSTSEENS